MNVIFVSPFSHNKINKVNNTNADPRNQPGDNEEKSLNQENVRSNYESNQSNYKSNRMEEISFANLQPLNNNSFGDQKT
jgi:hypothetical protein